MFLTLKLSYSDHHNIFLPQNRWKRKVGECEMFGKISSIKSSETFFKKWQEGVFLQETELMMTHLCCESDSTLTHTHTQSLNYSNPRSIFSALHQRQTIEKNRWQERFSGTESQTEANSANWYLYLCVWCHLNTTRNAHILLFEYQLLHILLFVGCMSGLTTEMNKCLKWKMCL